MKFNCKHLLVFGSLLFSTFSNKAQEVNNVQCDDMHKASVRKTLNLPTIDGLETLKCDFHIHTIFSDGIVWPTYRVTEAWEEGLDVIAITDHLEKNPSKPHVGGDDNASYEIALPEAKKKGILLVKATEITRPMPPGHLNALFISDANKLEVDDPVEAIRAAKQQGAFIIWNHPGWKAQQPDTCLWMEMHETLFQQGMINGIEVFNEKEWYPVVLDWCKKRNIAVIGTSDIHDICAHYYDLVHSHRPMTLVFAKSKTKKAVKEAMFQNNILAYWGNNLAGRDDLLTKFVNASIVQEGLVLEKLTLRNTTDIDFLFEDQAGTCTRIPAMASIQVDQSFVEQTFTVKNLHIESNKQLQFNFDQSIVENR